MRSALFILLGSMLAGCAGNGFRSLKAAPEFQCSTGVGGPTGLCSSIDFGEVQVGGSSAVTLFLANTGTAKLTVTSSEWDASSSATFTSQFSITSVDIHGQRAFTISFAPLQLGHESGTFVVHVAGGSVAELELAVSGTGVGKPVLVVAPEAIEFGHVLPEMSATLPVSLSNTGNIDLHVTQIALSATTSSVYSLGGVPQLPLVLSPGGTQEVSVTYNTTGREDALADTGALLVTSDDATNASVTIPINGDCPECEMPPVIPDPGCDETFPHRLWATGADVPTCSRGSVVGPNSPVNWTNYSGCGNQRDFPTTPGKAIRISTWGDGCGCPGCVLWHINYALQEDSGGGFQTVQQVSQPDTDRCPAGSGTHDETSYTPATALVRMVAQQGSSGMGYYYTVCGE